MSTHIIFFYGELEKKIFPELSPNISPLNVVPGLHITTEFYIRGFFNHKVLFFVFFLFLHSYFHGEIRKIFIWIPLV